MRGRFACILAATVVVVYCGHHAHAVIKVDTPLKSIEGSAVYILVGKVEKFFPDKPAMLVDVVEDIKGKAPFRQLPINCKVADEKTAKENLIEPLMKRLGPDLDIIFFIEPRGKSYITFAYTNGTWFQLQGSKLDQDRAVFQLRSAEPYFHKSFHGPTADLRKLLKDHAAGNAKLPPIDDKVKPGLGPEYKEKGESKKAKVDPPRNSFFLLPFSFCLGKASLGESFAVIPTLGIGAPLAILALLFPTVFGGVFVLFRQWLAFITLISINSTLMIAQWALLELAPGLLRGSWWGTGEALWFAMMLCTFLCACWSWRRQLNALSEGAVEAPRKTELMILSFMSASGLGALLVVAWISKQISWADAGWTVTVVMTLGIVAGTLYRAFHVLKGDTLFGAPPLATEGVILCAMLLGHVAFVPAIWGANVSTEGNVETNQGAAATTRISKVIKKWDYVPEARIKGMYASSPLGDGDAVYACYSGVNQYATLVRLDRNSGELKWEFFGKNDDLRQMISTPCIADGKLYFGEGFHDDKNCRIFCVDATKGEELWSVKTSGQTESSPTVANGKLYIGAGNDGVYCLDAKTGKELWKFPPKDYKGRLLRFGGGMLVVGERLYCATGVDRNQTKDKGETAAFCLDANTGKEIWKTPAPYPVWSKPIVRDGFLYLSCGNGDVFEDAQPPDQPGGMLLCLDTDNGKEKWRFKAPNGIIEAPAVDEGRVYFGCRDGQLYCVGRADGKERWRHFLDSAIIATPVLDIDAKQRTISVFAIANAGKICCLDPLIGDIVWTYNLTQQRAYITSSPALVVTREKDGSARRQLYFGCGLGGGTRDLPSNRPVFYCLEDSVKVE